MTLWCGTLALIGELEVDIVISVNGVPWVGDIGVSGVSLSDESSVDDSGGTMTDSGGGMWSDE